MPWYGDVVIICRSVGEVCANGESNRLILNNSNKKVRLKPLHFDNTKQICIMILCEHMNYCNNWCKPHVPRMGENIYKSLHEAVYE